MSRALIDKCKRFFNDAPDDFNPLEVLRYFLALNQNYQIEKNHMPVPIWRRKGFKDHGVDAWEILQQVNQHKPAERGLSIYLHVPFCPARCSFCDCLTMQLKNHVDRTLDQYTQSLLYEIEAWHKCGTLHERPVTTIHFGGGTPLFLGYKRFKKLVTALRSAFNVKTDTEWALETTSTSLNPPMLALLTDLGFRRLHLGVQSMEGHIRPLLKRRESAHQVLKKISRAKASGWVTSVDLLVGLPQETLSGMLDGINALIKAGTDGFSVYEINISNQNMRFAKAHHLLDRDRCENYFLFTAAVIYLLNHGYQKNLFNHFANPTDQNLYFTYPTRDEDCLAIGAYADGVFDDYHYRHQNYRKTIDDTSPTMPALEGGIKRSPLANRLFPIEIALLAGQFSEGQLTGVFSADQVKRLIDPWIPTLLVEETQPGCYALTPNGAWFSGNMIADLERIAA